MEKRSPLQEKEEFAALQLKSAVKVVVVVSLRPDIYQTSHRAPLVDAITLQASIAS